MSDFFSHILMFRSRVAANFAGLVQARGRFAVPHFYATADTGDFF